jgi:hypothetical protein
MRIILLKHKLSRQLSVVCKIYNYEKGFSTIKFIYCYELWF